MADLSSVYDALRQANASGDTASVQKLADYIRSQSSGSPQQAAPKNRSYDSDGQGHFYPTGSAAAAEQRDPTSGMSTLDQFTAAAGKAPVDLARGVGQMVGLESRKDVADSRAQDAPLMATRAGKWGNLAGNVGTLAPAMLIPGANTYAGATAIGLASGLAAPSTSTGETIGNTLLGGALAPAGMAIGRGAVGLARGAKAAFIDPFTKSGQQAIAARAMQSFAGSPQAATNAASALSNAPSVLPGVQPTTAELANNAGLAQLERTLRNNPEYMQSFNSRDQGNRDAIMSALQGIAQSPADRAAAVAARSKAAEPLYRQAGASTVPVDDDLQTLLQRPSMQKAAARAQTLANERGDGPIILPEAPKASSPASIDDQLDAYQASLAGNAPPAPATIPGKSVQYLKMGLNDIADTGEQKGMGAHEMGAVKQTLGSLNDWIAKNAPDLKAADTTYEGLSRPINRMDIGQDFLDKTKPALGDFGNTTRLNANNFANSVARQGDTVAARASGNPNATLSTILEPHELDALQKVGQQFARRANANDLGRAVGSNTGQNLVSQNVLSQFLGPLGLPDSSIGRMAGSAVYRTLGKLGSKTVYTAAEPDVMGLLTKAGLDPKVAAGLLNQPLTTGAKVPRLNALSPLLLGTNQSTNSAQ